MHANKPQIMEQQKKTREIYIKTQNSNNYGQGDRKIHEFYCEKNGRG